MKKNKKNNPILCSFKKGNFFEKGGVIAPNASFSSATDYTNFKLLSVDWIKTQSLYFVMK